MNNAYSHKSVYGYVCESVIYLWCIVSNDSPLNKGLIILGYILMLMTCINVFKLQYFYSIWLQNPLVHLDILIIINSR